MFNRTHKHMYNRLHRKITGLAITLIGFAAIYMVTMPLRAENLLI